MTSFVDICACGCIEVELVAGQELRITQVEVAVQ